MSLVEVSVTPEEVQAVVSLLQRGNSPDQRLDGYTKLQHIQTEPDDEETAAEICRNLGQLLMLMRTDLLGTSLEMTVNALKSLAFFLHDAKYAAAAPESEVCAVLKSFSQVLLTTRKDEQHKRPIINLCLWCISQQQVPPPALSAVFPHLLRGILHVMDEMNNNIPITFPITLEAFKALENLLSQIPDEMRQHGPKWVVPVCRLLVAGSKRERDAAEKCLSSAAAVAQLLPPSPVLGKAVAEEVRSSLLSQMERLAQDESTMMAAIRAWVWLLRLMAPAVAEKGAASTNLVNGMLKIPETTLVASNPDIRAASQMAWQTLVSILAGGTSVPCSSTPPSPTHHLHASKALYGSASSLMTSGQRLQGRGTGLDKSRVAVVSAPSAARLSLLIRPLVSSALQERDESARLASLATWHHLLGSLGPWSSSPQIFATAAMPMLEAIIKRGPLGCDGVAGRGGRGGGSGSSIEWQFAVGMLEDMLSIGGSGGSTSAGALGPEESAGTPADRVDRLADIMKAIGTSVQQRLLKGAAGEGEQGARAESNLKLVKVQVKKKVMRLESLGAAESSRPVEWGAWGLSQVGDMLSLVELVAGKCIPQGSSNGRMKGGGRSEQALGATPAELVAAAYAVRLWRLVLQGVEAKGRNSVRPTAEHVAAVHLLLQFVRRMCRKHGGASGDGGGMGVLRITQWLELCWQFVRAMLDDLQPLLLASSFYKISLVEQQGEETKPEQDEDKMSSARNPLKKRSAAADNSCMTSGEIGDAAAAAAKDGQRKVTPAAYLAAVWLDVAMDLTSILQQDEQQHADREGAAGVNMVVEKHLSQSMGQMQQIIETGMGGVDSSSSMMGFLRVLESSAGTKLEGAAAASGGKKLEVLLLVWLLVVSHCAKKAAEGNETNESGMGVGKDAGFGVPVSTICFPLLLLQQSREKLQGGLVLQLLQQFRDLASSLHRVSSSSSSSKPHPQPNAFFAAVCCHVLRHCSLSELTASCAAACRETNAEEAVGGGGAFWEMVTCLAVLAAQSVDVAETTTVAIDRSRRRVTARRVAPASGEAGGSVGVGGAHAGTVGGGMGGGMGDVAKISSRRGAAIAAAATGAGGGGRGGGGGAAPMAAADENGIGSILALLSRCLSATAAAVTSETCAASEKRLHAVSIRLLSCLAALLGRMREQSDATCMVRAFATPLTEWLSLGWSHPLVHANAQGEGTTAAVDDPTTAGAATAMQTQGLGLPLELSTALEETWSSLLSLLEKAHPSASWDAAALSSLTPLLLPALLHPHVAISERACVFWNVTFGSLVLQEAAGVPGKLKTPGVSLKAPEAGVARKLRLSPELQEVLEAVGLIEREGNDRPEQKLSGEGLNSPFDDSSSEEGRVAGIKDGEIMGRNEQGTGAGAPLSSVGRRPSSGASAAAAGTAAALAAAGAGGRVGSTAGRNGTSLGKGPAGPGSHAGRMATGAGGRSVGGVRGGGGSGRTSPSENRVGVQRGLRDVKREERELAAGAGAGARTGTGAGAGVGAVARAAAAKAGGAGSQGRSSEGGAASAGMSPREQAAASLRRSSDSPPIAASTAAAQGATPGATKPRIFARTLSPVAGASSTKASSKPSSPRAPRPPSPIKQKLMNLGAGIKSIVSSVGRRSPSPAGASKRETESGQSRGAGGGIASDSVSGRGSGSGNSSGSGNGSSSGSAGMRRQSMKSVGQKDERIDARNSARKKVAGNPLRSSSESLKGMTGIASSQQRVAAKGSMQSERVKDGARGVEKKSDDAAMLNGQEGQSMEDGGDADWDAARGTRRVLSSKEEEAVMGGTPPNKKLRPEAAALREEGKSKRPMKAVQLFGADGEQGPAVEDERSNEDGQNCEASLSLLEQNLKVDDAMAISPLHDGQEVFCCEGEETEDEDDGDPLEAMREAVKRTGLDDMLCALEDAASLEDLHIKDIVRAHRRINGMSNKMAQIIEKHIVQQEFK